MTIVENMLAYTSKRRELPSYVYKKGNRYAVRFNYGNYKKDSASHCRWYLGSYTSVEEAKAVRDQYVEDLESYKDLVLTD